jgi:glutamate dehydrogenase
MFDLPRSGWNDYDKKVISKGGGVFSRAEKSVALTPEIQTLLGTEETQLHTEEVIRILLTLNVDLLYNGGLGTYIKSSQEDNREVGDKSNDAVRVDGGNVRAKVVGEGGNLGVTQKGRIEYAIKGGLINTDAIDNSGGVDCSDREVNLKILFGPLINKGKMTIDERNKILKSLTSEVLAKILDDSEAHALCLSLDEIRSQKDPYLFLRTKEFLADMKVLVPKREDLPSLEALQKRGLKKGFTRPELSKLMAFFKMYVKAELLVLDPSKFPLREEFLKSYFPKKVYDNYSENISTHILIRELLATIWIGRIINFGGASIFTDLVTDSERSVQDVAFAYTAAERWMNAQDLKRRIMANTQVSHEAKFQGIVAVEDGIKGAASWILHFYTGEKLYQQIGNGQDFSSMAKKFNTAFEDILKNLNNCSSPQVGTLRMANDIEKFEGLGLPHDIAQDIASSVHWSKVFPVEYLASKTGKSSVESAKAYLICGKVTGMHGILSRIANQPSADHWEAQALRSLRASLRRTLLLLTERALVVGVNEALKREPSLTQVGEEIARLHANPSDAVPVSLLVVMGEKLHKAVTRL